MDRVSSDAIDEQQDELPTPAPVKIRDDESPLADAVRLAESESDYSWQQRDVENTLQGLVDRELEDGAPVSDNTVGCWAVYDNSELRFWPGLDVHDDRAAAQRELDELRPTTGHDLVVVEV